MRYLNDKNIVSPVTGKYLNEYECVKDNNHFKKSHIMLHQDHINYDPDYIKYQVCDFGIQWVYYMDWDVYMSQELY